LIFKVACPARTLFVSFLVHFSIADFKGSATFFTDNPTRKFLTNRIAAFFKFGPIKLIYSEKTPSRVKKQPAE
jgi:hypothetical protein